MNESYDVYLYDGEKKEKEIIEKSVTKQTAMNAMNIYREDWVPARMEVAAC